MAKSKEKKKVHEIIWLWSEKEQKTSLEEILTSFFSWSLNYYYTYLLKETVWTWLFVQQIFFYSGMGSIQ